MTPEDALVQMVEFYKKTQKVNIFLLRRIAAHAEMSNRLLTEAVAHIRGQSLKEVDAWFRQEYKVTSQGLRDTLYTHFGPDLNWDDILPPDGDLRDS